MKRDTNLVRDILFSIENDETEVKGYNEVIVSSHLHLMINAGLINGHKLDDTQWQVLGLTWEGYELLDLIRDFERWKTIERIMDDLNCYSFEVIRRIAIKQMKL